MSSPETPANAGRPDAKPRWYGNLYVQVLCAIALGIGVGTLFPEFGTKLKPLGDGFIKLVKMIIAPIIFCTVVQGIAGMSDLKKVGRVGLKALLYFEALTTIALVIGLVTTNLAKPGAGMNVDAAHIDASSVSGYIRQAKEQSAVDFVLHVIPDTVVGAFAEGEILQVLLLAILAAFALHGVGERGKPLIALVDASSAVLFKVVAILMRAAPIGAFGAMAFTIGKFGIATLASLVKLMLCFYATCLLFVFAVLGIIAWLAGFSILKFVRYIREELLIVLGTSSSEAALPRMLAKMERLGCHRSVVGLVIPTGYSFNLDGTCIYLTLAAVFLAQATNTPLSLGQELGLIGVLLLTSKGAAAVTGSGFIVLAATLASVGHIPVASIALILGVDRFMSEGRALTNLVGNGVATIVVSKWEGALDLERLRRELDHPGKAEGEVAEQPVG
ncbi:dicarboxylate/amino acid:cation symporter [Chondromyces crocatus]|uniref:C4-dicarboxylate transport protein n=1 Tax=Chondromyces crocatus TaxID=52 RepID=A0A0K1EBB5_CHOCO|nr:dicarboxylate/amino acid:cation symporter [Chondromyces crocatus]AKT37977.1 C4-dicarboxylate ABC transporter [Chondromyces crocatus]